MNHLNQRNSRKIFQGLEKLKKQLQKLLNYQQPVYLRIKKICQILNYLIKIFKNQQNVDEQLHLSMKMLKMLVMITNYYKFGHQFAFVCQLIKRYQSYVHGQIEINHQQMYKKMQIYEGTAYQKSLNFLPISPTELSFRLTAQINTFLIGINQNQIALPNSQCVCCSQVFVANVPLGNFNPFFTIIGQMSAKKVTEKVVLKRSINGICNSGGGALLVGVQKKQGILYPIGLKFKSKQQIAETQNDIIAAIASIKPDCTYRIDKIHVMTHLSNKVDIQQRKVRICFKILLFPIAMSKMSFIQFSAKGYQKAFEVYQLDQDLNTEEIGLGKKFYEKVHSKYYSIRKRINLHQNIKCVLPVPYNLQPEAKTKAAQGAANKLIQIGPQDNESDSSAHLSQQVEQDKPKFEYSNASLLAVRSSNHDRYVKSFYKYLLKQIQKVSLIQPFANSFKNCSRSIWMLSHEIQYDEIKQHLDSCGGNKQISPQQITIMPIFKNLEVERNKLSDHNEQIFTKKFKLKFKESFRIQNSTMIDKNNKQRQVVYFSFNDYSQAIYAYLIFEEFNLRPFFVRQTASMKKQCKLSSAYKF